MKVSRDYALSELKSVRDTLNEWIDSLESPQVLDAQSGEPVAVYENIPPGVSVSDLEGLDADQLRAEVMAIAGRLESLVMA